VASAAIDVSDGLAQDVAHVAAASRVAIVLDEGLLRGHAGEALERTAGAARREALDLLLHGGEDYALIAMSVTPIPGFTRVGEVRAGSGVILRTGDVERPIEPRGFDHFKVD
jgi:thiamine-monophosphate kinase